MARRDDRRRARPKTCMDDFKRDAVRIVAGSLGLTRAATGDEGGVTGPADPGAGQLAGSWSGGGVLTTPWAVKSLKP